MLQNFSKVFSSSNDISQMLFVRKVYSIGEYPVCKKIAKLNLYGPKLLHFLYLWQAMVKCLNLFGNALQ